MSNYSLGNPGNIPECTPMEGETEIDKRAYEFWKETLITTLGLARSADEQWKFGVFKIRAGVKLREIYSTTVSSATMPNECTAPFSNALARLDDYFNSRSYILTQRGNLMNMCQLQTEKNIDFVHRVSSAAKLCNYSNDEKMEAIVRVITAGANDGKIRILARRNWLRQGTMNDLIDLVREHELEKAIIEDVQKNHSHVEAATVAMVSRNPQEIQGQGNYRGNWRGNWRGRRSARGIRGRGGRGRGFSHGSLQNPRGSRCWRCGGFTHPPSSCPVAGYDCHSCGRVGHIASMCVSSNQQTQAKAWKRPAGAEDYGVPRKIAAIENPGEDMEGNNEVRKMEDEPE